MQNSRKLRGQAREKRKDLIATALAAIMASPR